MKKEKNSPRINNGQTASDNRTNSVGALEDKLLIYAYLLACLLPSFGAIDTMGSQWMFLAGLNIISSVRLYRMRSQLKVSLLYNLPMIFFSAFSIVSLLSFAASFNLTESIVSYSRLIITLITIVNLIFLLANNRSLLRESFFLLGIISLIEAFTVFQEFVTNLGKYTSMNDVIYNIRENTGNKNILAASIMIKLPALLFLIVERKGFWRGLFAVSFLLSVTAVAILNARSAYIGTIAGVGTTVIASLMLLRGTEGYKNILKGISISGLCLAGGILLSVLIFNAASKGKKTQNYTSVIERTSSIEITNEASSGRLKYWGYARDFITKHSLLGGGYGNWKINEIPYEKHFRNGFGSAKHTHNDFLEVTVDTGIVGGLLYILVFISLAILLLKGIKKKAGHAPDLILLLVLAGTLFSYLVDAFFNFPLERPVMQVMFSLMMAGIITMNFNRENDKTSRPGFIKGVLLSSLFLGIACTVISFKVFKSMRFQQYINSDWAGTKNASGKTFTSAEVMRGLPDFPNINEVASMPIACIKAKYLAQEKKYREAFALLDADHNSNPNLFYAEFIKSKSYEEIGNRDSALYYAKMAFENRPSNLQLFQHYNGMLARNNDSTAVRKTYHEIYRWNKNPEACHVFIENLYFCTHTPESFMEELTAAYKANPTDTTLHFDYGLYNGGILQNQEKYDEALKWYREVVDLKPKDQFVRSNLAYCSVMKKNYSEALPFYNSLIDDGYGNDGKFYYYRAICLINMNQKSNACNDIVIALRNGFQVPDDFRRLCSQKF